jgi:hypothetical protein
MQMPTATIEKPVALRGTEAVEAELQRRLAGRRRDGHGDHLDQVPTIKVANGLSFSMQASAYHYCSPRDSYGPWDAVELGFPSRRVEALRKYAEDPKRLTKTVYGWVPLTVVAEVVEAAGGLLPAEA